MVCEMYDILVGLSHWFQAMTGTSSVEMVKVRRMDPRTAKETQWEWALITTDATFSLSDRPCADQLKSIKFT